MALTRTFPTDRAAGLPLADTRLLVAAMVESDTTGKPRAGVLPSHYIPLVTGTTGMAYSVAAFSAVTVRSGMGAELVANDGAATVATTAAPGANSRIDVIWVRSLFTTTGDSGTDPVFGVTQGVAAAFPLKPSIPAGALELATAVVLSTTTQTSTAVITQTHPFTSMEGGTVALRNQVEQDAWTPTDGSAAFRVDTGVSLVRVSGSWVAGSKAVISAGGGLVGGAPSTGAQVLVQSGSTVAIVNTVGDGMNIVFPVAFTGGLASVVAVNGDASLAGSVRGMVNPSLSGCGIKWDGIPSNGARRATWVATGWMQ